jgi:hypothetical protein
MAYKQLRDNIKTLLDELSSSFAVISSVPSMEFSGYPAAFVGVSGNENEFQSTQDNMRIYAYKIWVFTQYDQDTFATAYDLLLDLAESVINKLDEQESPDSAREMADSLDAKYTLAAVEAIPGRFASDEVEKLLALEITVRCKVLVDLTQLT